MNKLKTYADHAATTPLSPTALEAMQPFLEQEYGNPSTVYSLARRPRKAINDARALIAEAINADPSEVYFTSGGSESDNLAIKGIAFRFLGQKKRFITSSIEHHAVLHSFDALRRYGFSTTELPVDREGVIQCDELCAALTPDTALVSIMLANNEIGTIEPVQALAEIAHANGAIFHTDAVQAVGHIPIDVKALGVDLLSASAHKFNGPKGVGFLYARNGMALEPMIHGGGQESGMRSGTENVAGIVGMAAALKEHAGKLDAEARYLNLLQKKFINGLRAKGLDFIENGSVNRIPGNVSLSFANASGEMLLHRLDLMGISIATGSACNSNETTVSHVIQAIGVPEKYANGTIRVSLGPENTEDEVLTIIEGIYKILNP